MIFLMEGAETINICETIEEAIGYVKGAKLNLKDLTIIEGEGTSLVKCEECGQIITEDTSVVTRGKILCEKCCENK